MEREDKLNSSTGVSTRKRAAIVTFTHGANYGCDLQRFAMQETLRSLALEPTFIDYNPAPEHEDTPPSEKKFDAILRRLTLRSKPDVCRKFRRFNDFRARAFNSTDRLSNYAQVEALRARFDVFVAGSDQIWNPIWETNDEYFRYYMMQFAPCERKISYAASTGVTALNEQTSRRFKELLRGYAWISVREREGAEMLRRVLERDVDVVLDPTFLLTRERWELFAELADASYLPSESYVLCYSLGNRRKTTRLARLVRKKLGVKKIVYLCSSERERRRIQTEYWGVTPVWGADPCDFAALIRGAACVVTDSFHASVFASIFHRPFLTFERDSGEAPSSMNSRLNSLFATFELESHRVPFDWRDAPLTAPIESDYSKFDAVWNALRDESLQKLDGALKLVLGKDYADPVRS